MNLTDAPIMLPAELPDELKNIAIDENSERDSYGIVFKSSPPDDLVEPVVNATTVGTLTAIPNSEYEPDQAFKATSTESVELAVGLEGEISYMEPSVEVANYSPRWEGIFEKNGYTYTVSVRLGRNGEEITEQALSTMVAVE